MPKKKPKSEAPRLTHSTQYLEFYWDRDSPSGKTSVWTVQNKQENALGTIHWLPAWRRYVYNTRHTNCLLDVACLQDIIDFIKAQMEVRAERLAIQEES
jgi:hypothetical protein